VTGVQTCALPISAKHQRIKIEAMQHTMQHIRTTIIAICLSLLSLTAQESDSLNLYLEIAGRNNPGLNADFLTYKSSLEKVHQAGAWSDPTMEIGFFLKPMDIVGGRQ